MKIENITACVFDAYGTLFDVNSAAAKCKEKLGRSGRILSTFSRSNDGLVLGLWLG